MTPETRADFLKQIEDLRPQVLAAVARREARLARKAATPRAGGAGTVSPVDGDVAKAQAAAFAKAKHSIDAAVWGMKQQVAAMNARLDAAHAKQATVNNDLRKQLKALANQGVTE